MKSIKFKILVPTLCVLLSALLCVGLLAALSNNQTVRTSLNQTLTQTVNIAADLVSSEILKKQQVLVEAANTDTFKYGSIKDRSLMKESEEIRDRNGFVSLYKADKDGYTSQGFNILDRAYFQQCKDTMKPAVSDMLIDKESGQLTMVFVAPIVSNGKFDGVICGTVGGEFLGSIAADITIGETGVTTIIDKAGTVIGFQEVQYVLDQFNSQEAAKSDPTLQNLAALESRMVSGESGFGQYTFLGDTKLTAYTQIPNSNGWSIYIAVENGEFLKVANIATGIIIVISIVFAVLATLILLVLSNKIAKPIKLCAIRIQKLAEGDLTSEVPEFRTKDETGLLAKSTRQIVQNVSGIIQDLDNGLNEMGRGNFTVESKAQELYVGDFNSLLVSASTIADQLSSTLSLINQSSDQVASGSDQVSGGAQALSQGATEQASSIEELSATISDISEQIKMNAENATKAKATSETSGIEIQESNRQMKEMIVAMDAIREKSNEIGKIIKTIDDIAFQTNILALNAAVEAARAGAAGKGFAVVADEVRNLAGKSAEAAKNTATLIEEAIQAVKNGTQMADNTAQAIMTVVEGAQTVVTLVEKIAAASNEQANAIVQVTMGVEQISNVVQTNSATAEESAAASEELSGQAQVLKQLVSRFKLKDAQVLQEFSYEAVEEPDEQTSYELPNSKY